MEGNALHPTQSCLINKGSGYYSESKRYRDPFLTYNQTMADFDGLLMLGCVEVTKEGYFDRTTLQGSLTKFVARDELLERLQEIEDYPALSIKPDLNKESIILRDAIDGQRKAIEYDDTPTTVKYRQNLKKINRCFLRHWADFEIKDTDVVSLEASIRKNIDGLPIDLSAR